MDLIADSLLVAGAFGAAIYCHVLAQRLKRISALEGGLGGAIAVLSAQVDDMTRALHQAQATASGSAGALEQLNTRAAASTARLELLLAALHDLPSENEVAKDGRQVRRRRRVYAPEEAAE